MNKKELFNKGITVSIGIILIIGILTIYSLFIQYSLKNTKEAEKYLLIKEDYIKVQVERTVEMIEIHMASAPKIQSQKLNDVIHDLESDVHSMDEYFEGEKSLEDLIRPYGAINPYIRALLVDKASRTIIDNTSDTTYEDIVYDDNIIYSEFKTQAPLTLVVYLTYDDLKNIALKHIIPSIRDIRLEDDGYIWVNEVLDYHGGDQFAMRIINANVLETEGDYLSTNTVDIQGNTHYKTELDGINEQGEILFDYYFKEMNSDKLSHKISYAKLYEPFDWIIGTGVYIDDMDYVLKEDRDDRKKQLYKEISVFSIITFALLCIFLWQMRLYKRNRTYKKDNLDLSHTVQLRSEELELLNEELLIENKERKNAEHEIKKINQGLDVQVNERTKDLELLNSILESSVKKAEEANKAKSTFLSIMSHEMRTPLNGIKGFVQMLETSGVTEDQQEMLGIVNESTEKLLALTNDILDVDKYSQGIMDYAEEVFNIKELLEQDLRRLSGITDSTKVKFRPNISTHLDYDVIGDPEKILQVVNNLVSNAFKFTSEGMVQLIVEGEYQENMLKVSLIVSDTGIGIKDIIKPYMFEPFTQADMSIAREFGGTGLGLSICKDVVNYYDGDITFDSQPNVGSTFTAYFKLKLVDKGDQMYSEDESFSIPRRVLVAEDNPVNQLLMKEFMKKLAIPLDIANNGQEALDMTLHTDYDVIFMDCQMPVMDGFEATQLIKCNPNFKGRIIAMTAYTHNEVKQKCKHVGMDDFLTKPVNLEMLAKRLGKQFKREAEFVSQTVSPKEIIIEKEVIKLMNLINFDSESCHELILIYIDQTILSLKALRESVQNNDMDQVKMILHKLKGSTVTVHIDRLVTRFDEAMMWVEVLNMKELENVISSIENDKLFI